MLEEDLSEMPDCKKVVDAFYETERTFIKRQYVKLQMKPEFIFHLE